MGPAPPTDTEELLRRADRGDQEAVEELFDLAADPHEEKNLAQDPAQAQTLSRLRARCDEYRITLK